MEDFNWGKFEQDQRDFDERMHRAAFENTYLILTGKATYEALLEKESMQKGSIDQYMNTAVLFNPMSDEYSPKFPHLHNQVDRNEMIDTMIEYFTETEEYEKCAELVKTRQK
tara:strand:+ start:155 stop:490 length:336 start_codon:yes stop_codon:yes gene_type:complete